MYLPVDQGTGDRQGVFACGSRYRRQARCVCLWIKVPETGKVCLPVDQGTGDGQGMFACGLELHLILDMDIQPLACTQACARKIGLVTLGRFSLCLSQQLCEQLATFLTGCIQISLTSNCW